MFIRISRPFSRLVFYLVHTYVKGRQKNKLFAFFGPLVPLEGERKEKNQQKVSKKKIITHTYKRLMNQ